MTIVRNLIEGHNGSVEARSEGPGRGSGFIVRLPRVMRTSEFTDSRGDAGNASDKSADESLAPRVLIVDDNQDGAEILTLSLGYKGYHTRVAYDAPTALKIAAEFLPEIGTGAFSI